MSKRLRLLALVLAVSVALSGCGGNKKDCAHDYYASDYSAPTASENGYNEYTCKKCGDSYKEVIPMLSSDGTDNTQDDEESNGGHKKDDRTINLFELPIYSSSYWTSEPSFESDYLDISGYHHKNCYILWSGENDGWVRYDLGGSYSKLSCKLYGAYNSYGDTYVEFYDGDEFLGSTARMNQENPSVEYELDITGVEYLTIHCKGESYNSTHVIFDPITISK